jgi:hypothetical protein
MIGRRQQCKECQICELYYAGHDTGPFDYTSMKWLAIIRILGDEVTTSNAGVV